MVTLEEYLKAKKIVEEYEEQEFSEACETSLYCISCQALEAHDCFCDEEDYYYEECEDCGKEPCVCEYIMNCSCGAWTRTGAHVSDCICGGG